MTGVRKVVCVNLETNQRAELCLPQGYSGPQFITSTAILLYWTQATKPIQRDCVHSWRLAYLLQLTIYHWPRHCMRERLKQIEDSGTSPYTRHQFWPGLYGGVAGDWAHLTLTAQAQQLLVLLETSSVSWALLSSFSLHCQVLSVQETWLDTALIWLPHTVSQISSSKHVYLPETTRENMWGGCSILTWRENSSTQTSNQAWGRISKAAAE